MAEKTMDEHLDEVSEEYTRGVGVWSDGVGSWAEMMATRAMEAAEEGEWSRAVDFAARAMERDLDYNCGDAPVWGRFFEAVEAGAGAAEESSEASE